jgi:subtilisin family serine protease
MHKAGSRVFLVLAVLSLAIFAVDGASAQIVSTGKSVPGEVLVKFRNTASSASVRDAEQQGNVEEDELLTQVPDGTIRRLRSGSQSTDQLMATLRNHPAVAYVEPNYIVHALLTPNDPSYSQTWGLKNTGQVIGGVAGTAGADIKAEAAWDVTTGSRSIVIAVIDTGIQYTHPDLAANMWTNPGGIGGCAAGTFGYNAVANTCNPMDDHYHGTHCAGTIGGVGNNATGVPGVNWVASLMALKFLDSSGSGTTADAIESIDFAVNAKIAGVNVRVLSNSWGGGAFSQALLDAINRANTNDILFVAAAGNSALNNDTTPHYPSSYNAPNVISVAATDNRDGLASFSNYGATTVHLGAPGVDTYSTMTTDTYGFLSGTSMATPHVSGVAGLVLAKTPTLTVAQVKSAILNNVDAVPSLSGRTTTGGRLNAAKAVGPAGPPPAPDYTLAISPSSATATQGASAAYTVNINRVGGFAGGVTFTISGLPAGAAGTFNPNPSTGATSALTVTTSTTTPVGSYVFTVTGTSGALTRTATATLVVQAPAAGDFTLTRTPTSRTITAGQSTTYTVSIARTGGFTGAVTFSVSGLGTGQTASFSPNNTTGNSSTLTITTTTTAATGSRVLTITGTSGALSRTTTVTLVVNPSSGCQGQC